ncbi:MAG: hydrolase 1, exosortase A system-associated [Parasphingorhabdus sp.]|uniref:hydrolase 1, exosortase A system-associated n=1 Tax=Parasphingorhabdus sp. TaxID=2709688 RepID=UPI00329A440F
MSRSFHQFSSDTTKLAGTLDSGPKTAGLLIVSGGNEIRAGSHGGMARLAQNMGQLGYPVFRYDRAGIGESGGENRGFLESAADIQAAIQYFQSQCPHMKKIVAFGNCDAASSLLLFSDALKLDHMVLSNPWVIDENTPDQQSAAPPSPSAIRSRYWDRIKNPQSVIDLFTGKINLIKLAKGLKQATQKQENSALAECLQNRFSQLTIPCEILLAQRDTTARAFLAAWHSSDFSGVRGQANINIISRDTASHSFADEQSKNWLQDQILDVLEAC